MNRTPKRSKLNKNDSKIIKDSPNNNDVRHNVVDSKEKSPANGSPGTPVSSNETRRGRPSAVALNTLIMQGSTSPSSIKCSYCNRVFPREKSLQAHLRTHTGERPYACDYPRCTRRFAQSGQLKTHQRLHTGEKPFVCANLNCLRRFTHVNRHCPEHPDLALIRYNLPLNPTVGKTREDEHSSAVQKWLENVKNHKENKQPSDALTTTPKKSYYNPKKLHLFMDQKENKCPSINSKHSLSKQFDDIRPILTTSIETPTSSKRKLPTESMSQEYASAEAMIQLGNISYQTTSQQLFNENGQSTSKENEIPKKRWLREAVLDQQKWESTQDLAQPLNWGDEARTVEYENQKRPSVVVRADKTERKEISKTDLQLAMALVELRNSTKFCNY